MKSGEEIKSNKKILLKVISVFNCIKNKCNNIKNSIPKKTGKKRTKKNKEIPVIFEINESTNSKTETNLKVIPEKESQLYIGKLPF